MKTDVLVGNPGFAAFDAQHLCVLALTALLVAAMCRVARSDRFPSFAKKQTVVLGLLMLTIHPLTLLAAVLGGIPLHAGNSLPMHLCDWAAVVAFFALIWRRQFLMELTFFWGLAATLQGLLTPDLDYGFPHPAFLVFFLHHAGVVLAALYVAIGLRMVPRRHAVWKVFLWTQFYVVAAGVTNIVLKTNYGFLAAKPDSASLLDYMGSWPYYILSLEAVCIVVLLILDAPFIAIRKRMAKAGD